MGSIATKVLDFEEKGVEFQFKGHEPILELLSSYSPEVQLHFALHGMSQKFGDAYSSAKGVVGEALAMFQTTKSQLLQGDWKASRGEGDSKPRTTELAEALARIKALPVEEVAKTLAAASEELKKTLRSNDRVKAVIAVIRAEKAQDRLDKMPEDDIEL